MPIVTHRKLFYILSSLLVAASILALALWGLNLGIDFRGGSIVEVSYRGSAPTDAEVKAALLPFNLGGVSVRPTDEKGAIGYIIRMREVSDTEHQAVLTALGFSGDKPATEVRFNSLGPVLGEEAMGKSILAIVLVILVIVLFLAFAFRKVSEPISSWKYGIIAIVALIHDVAIPTGVFAVLGHFSGVEIDTLFVTALLVVLGFSVHDTIVVFDRVREHLRLNRELRQHKPFEQVVGESISETIARSINTSLTTLFAIAVLYALGPASTQYFALAIMIGIIAGTYSSICIASPLLVTVEKWQKE